MRTPLQELLQIPTHFWVVALPHGVTEEDEYAGYRIPEGATVMANVWWVALLNTMLCQATDV